MIARDSIRVEGQRGVILEVDYVEVPQFCGEEGDKVIKGKSPTIWKKTMSIQLSDYERKTSELESQCATLNDQMEVLQRRLKVLDGVAKQVGNLNKNLLNIFDCPDWQECAGLH
jgi:hypothetical protein